MCSTASACALRCDLTVYLKNKLALGADYRSIFDQRQRYFMFLCETFRETFSLTLGNKNDEQIYHFLYWEKPSARSTKRTECVSYIHSIFRRPNYNATKTTWRRHLTPDRTMEDA